MDRGIFGTIVLAVALGAISPSFAQAPRKDVIWARSMAGAHITMDGNLTEPAWAMAESVVIQYGTDTGIPGSGWKPEAGVVPQDPTNATLRFLVDGDTLWLGAVIRDKSIGGSRDFNRFDGLLMGIKDHGNANRPSPPTEYLYSWWYEVDTPPNDTAPGKMPSFRGQWSNCSVAPPASCYTPRTDEQKSAWNAAIVVNGITNDDNNVDGNPSDDDDWGYVVEMRFDVSVMGYDITRTQGDIVEWNVSVYDCDWLWPFQAKFSANRVWWENPWGNQAWYHNVRVHARPNITINSGPAPVIQPEFRIRAADGFAAPTINGALTEPVWGLAPSFDIRFDDPALRNSYASVGPYRSGQFQATVNASNNDEVQDPADGTVKWFFKGDKVYFGFDIRDQVVQYRSEFDRWDGLLVTINDRTVRGPDNNLIPRRLGIQVGPTGVVIAHDYLPYLRDTVGGAEVAMQLKPGTTVDTLGQQADQGYTVEMWVDLTKMGYPPGRGDGTIFLGINLLDGDSFTPFTDSYGTRTWWFREYEGEDGSAWGYLDPALQVTGIDEGPPGAASLALLGARPNPFWEGTEIRLMLPGPRETSLEVYDLQGRLVASRAYGLQGAGSRSLRFKPAGLGSGLYLYRVRLLNQATGVAERVGGKMMLVR